MKVQLMTRHTPMGCSDSPIKLAAAKLGRSGNNAAELQATVFPVSSLVKSKIHFDY